MQLPLCFDKSPPSAAKELFIGSAYVPIYFRRHRRARRYILRVTEEGTARVTVPQRGSIAEAWNFLLRHQDWILNQLGRTAVRRRWQAGDQIYFRGHRSPITLQFNPLAALFADQTVPLQQLSRDLRPAIEAYLRELASRELTARVREIATAFQFSPRAVTVRNQRTRWGSCSARGMISLNWKLVQTPDFVRDYIIFHELVHLKHLNHSIRFWNAVRKVCPDYSAAENWLKTHDAALRG